MGLYVYITSECKENARKHSLEDAINRFKDKLETQMTFQGLDRYLPLPFFKKRIDKHRLIIESRNFEGNSIACFIWLGPRKGTDYSSFLKEVAAPENSPKPFINKYKITEKELAGYMKTRLATPVENFPDLEDDDSNYLTQSTKLLAISYDVFVLESKDWTIRIIQDDKTPYMKIYQNILVSLVDKIASGKVNNEAVMEASEGGVTILYKYFERFSKLFLIAPLAPHDYDQKDQLIDYYNQLFSGGSGDSDLLIRKSGRSYPDYIAGDEELWFKVEQDETGANLSLSPEEMEIIDEIKFPTFINGRPGSGKSTMLLYLFSNSLCNYINQKGKNENKHQPLFLSYSRDLIQEAKKKVAGILKCNSNMFLEGFDLEEVINSKYFNNSFGSYGDFLRELLPVEKRGKFPPEKYIGFTQFSELWRKEISTPQLKKISHELIWHVIRTYIKGMRQGKNDYLDLDSFNEYPLKRRTVEAKTFKQISSEIWKPWYKDELCDAGGFWDDQDLTRELLDDKSCKLDRFSAIFCDEAQDFTKNEIELILKLSKFSKKSIPPYLLSNIPFVFAGDPFQTLNPTGFSWELVKADFHDHFLVPLIANQKYINGASRRSLDFNFKELNFNYRSAGNIVSFSNLIQLLRGVIFDNRNIRPQKAWKADLLDSPAIYSTASPEFQDVLEAEAEIVIIVPCEEGQETDYVKSDPLLRRIAFRNNKVTRNILSPIQAKGLEYSRVVIYKFGDFCMKQPVYKDLVKILEKCHWTETLKGEKHIPSTYFLNKLYVAVSRAQNKLIVADTNESIKKFWRFACDINVLRGLREAYSGKGYWSAEDLTTVQDGKRESWADNNGSSLRQADNFFKAGKANRNPYFLNLASQSFKRAGNDTKADLCQAEIYEIEEKYVKAGEIHYKQGNLLDTLRCYWIAKKFNYIIDLSNKNISIKMDLRVLAAKFIGESLDIEQSREIFNEILKELNSDHSGYNFTGDKTWGNALREKFSELYELIKSNSGTDVKSIWEVYTRIPLSIPTEKKSSKEVAHFAYLAEDTSYAYKLCKKEKHLDLDEDEWAIQLIADQSSYPENLSSLEKLNKHPEIVKSYLDNEDEEVSYPQSEIIWRSLQEEGATDSQIIFLNKTRDAELHKKFLGSDDCSGVTMRDKFLVGKNLLNLLIAEGDWEQAITVVGTKFKTSSKSGTEDKSRELHKALNVYFIKRLASSQELIGAPRHGKKIVGNYLKEELLGKIGHYKNDLTMLEGGSAIERASKHKDAIAYYNRAIANKEKLLQEKELKFAKERWVHVKSKQIEATSSPKEKRQRVAMENELERNRLQWSIKVDDIPKYPKIDHMGADKILFEPKEENVDSKTISCRKSKEAIDESPIAPVINKNKDLSGLATSKVEFSIDNTTFRCEYYQNVKIEIRNSDTQDMVFVYFKNESVKTTDELSIEQRKKTKRMTEWKIEDWGMLCQFEKNNKRKIVHFLNLSGDEIYFSFVGDCGDIS